MNSLLKLRKKEISTLSSLDRAYSFELMSLWRRCLQWLAVKREEMHICSHSSIYSSTMGQNHFEIALRIMSSNDFTRFLGSCNFFFLNFEICLPTQSSDDHQTEINCRVIYCVAPAKSREIVGVCQKIQMLFDNGFCPHWVQQNTPSSSKAILGFVKAPNAAKPGGWCCH